MTITQAKRLLVIDDDIYLANLFSDMFKGNGYEVETAYNGQEALQKIPVFNPSLITLDLLMPNMNGIEVLEWLQKDPITRSIPVIIVSVLDDPKVPAWIAKPFPVIEFFAKPVDAEKLLSCVKLILETKQPGCAITGQKKILAISDNNEIIETLKALFKTKDIEILVGSHECGVVEQVQKETPLAILLDLKLSDTATLNLFESLKKDPSTCHIPIVILSDIKLPGFFENGLWVAISRNPETKAWQVDTLLQEVEKLLKAPSTPQLIRSTRSHILIAEDDEAINKILQDIFTFEDFDVTATHDGKEALEKIYTCSPDIALLDVKMPKMDGYEVCRKVKEDILFQHMPIILLTVMEDTKDKVCGINCGADDYVTKPFAPEELLARVRMILRRTSQNLEANPLTRLPGNISIERKINSIIRQRMPFAVFYIDLDNFKVYNDKYGFARGDNVIRSTARILMEICGYGEFVGHIGGDDFIVVTNPQRMELLASAIIQAFDRTVPEFYDQEDRQRGYVVAQDRQGNKRQFPLLAISIGIVTNEHRNIRFYGEVSAIGTEMKKFAKQEYLSSYKIDRRE